MAPQLRLALRRTTGVWGWPWARALSILLQQASHASWRESPPGDTSLVALSSSPPRPLLEAA